MRLFLICLVAVSLLAAFAVTALASSVVAVPIPDPAVDVGGWLNTVLTAVRGSDWRLLAAAVLIGVVWAARRYGKKLIPWLETGRGGAVLALALGVLGAISNAILAGHAREAFSASLLLDGLEVGVLSAGGWTAFRHLLGLDSKKGT